MDGEKKSFDRIMHLPFLALQLDYLDWPLTYREGRLVYERDWYFSRYNDDRPRLPMTIHMLAKVG